MAPGDEARKPAKATLEVNSTARLARNEGARWKAASESPTKRQTLLAAPNLGEVVALIVQVCEMPEARVRVDQYAAPDVPEHLELDLRRPLVVHRGVGPLVAHSDEIVAVALLVHQGVVHVVELFERVVPHAVGIDEVDVLADRVLVFAGKPEHERGQILDVVLVEQLHASGERLASGALVHVLENAVARRLDPEVDAAAARVLHQLDDGFVGVLHAQEREPLEVVLAEHVQQLLEAVRRHVERVVDEDDLLEPRDAHHGVEMCAHLIGVDRLPAPCGGGVGAEGAGERTAGRGADLDRLVEERQLESIPGGGDLGEERIVPGAGIRHERAVTERARDATEVAHAVGGRPTLVGQHEVAQVGLGIERVDGVADAVLAHRFLEPRGVAVRRLRVGERAAEHDVHVRVVAPQQLRDPPDLLPREIEGAREADQRRTRGSVVCLAEPIPFGIDVVDDPKPDAELAQVVGQMRAAHGRQVPDVQHASALGVGRVTVELPEPPVVHVVEVSAELALVVHHARVDEALVEIEAIERQVRVAVVIDHVRLAHQEQVQLPHGAPTRPRRRTRRICLFYHPSAPAGSPNWWAPPGVTREVVVFQPLTSVCDVSRSS
jgi:hypothetical protein